VQTNLARTMMWEKRSVQIFVLRDGTCKGCLVQDPGQRWWRRRITERRSGSPRLPLDGAGWPEKTNTNQIIVKLMN
jgi:hypothetical protein